MTELHQHQQHQRQHQHILISINTSFTHHTTVIQCQSCMRARNVYDAFQAKNYLIKQHGNIGSRETWDLLRQKSDHVTRKCALVIFKRATCTNTKVRMDYCLIPEFSSKI